ncbi:MAG: hypothetical protein ACTHW1_04860 [Ancrocorticia sp.]|uniref:hypothetical protein n=1 Tax=Ancrocorticia sp. TaxID=2593684 RepID=UPI003F91DF3B
MRNKKITLPIVFGILALFTVTTSVIGNSTAQETNVEPKQSVAQQVPDSVEHQAESELEQFTGAFPEGVAEPTSAVEFIPELAGTTIVPDPEVYDDGQTYVLHKTETKPSTFASAANDSEDVTVVLVEGAFFNQYALQWHCSWLDEYLNAVDESDVDSAKTALTNLQGFADMAHVREHLPDVDQFQYDIVKPISSGDLTPARQYRAVCTGNE